MLPKKINPLFKPFWSPIYCYLINEEICFLEIYANFFKQIRADYLNGGIWMPTAPIMAEKYFYNVIKNETKTRMIAGMLLLAMDKAWGKVSATQAKERMLVIACMIEEFKLANGRLPTSLEELPQPLPVDLFSQKSFKYQQGTIPVYSKDGEEKFIVSDSPPLVLPVKIVYGYKLYGIGVNRIDNGGVQLSSGNAGDDIFAVYKRID